MGTLGYFVISIISFYIYNGSESTSLKYVHILQNWKQSWENIGLCCEGKQVRKS